jgi:hypothetical protein
MDSLASALERFNRKERNLLVRAVLGHEVKPVELSESFRVSVAKALKISIPPSAWWATDYHLEWLAGAIAVYAEGATAAVEKKARDNPPVEVTTPRRLVEGNQEDIDLVIASGLDLILIEAKGASPWDNQQLRSKLVRLKHIHAEAEKARDAVQFHLLLMSPRHSERLDVEWPDWALIDSEDPAWIELPFPRDSLMVSRCDERGNPNADGKSWCVRKQI